MRTVQQNQKSEALVGLCIGGRQLADVFEIRAHYMIPHQRTPPHGDSRKMMGLNTDSIEPMLHRAIILEKLRRRRFGKEVYEA